MKQMIVTMTSFYWCWLLCVTLLAAKPSLSIIEIVCGKCTLSFSSLHQRDFDVFGADAISPALTAWARFDWIESDNNASPAEADKWYRGRMASSTLSAVDSLNTYFPITSNTNQDLSCNPLHAVEPECQWANDLLQSRRTSGIREVITQSQRQATLNVSTESDLNRNNNELCLKPVAQSPMQ